MPWPGAFSDKVTPDIDFVDKTVVHGYVPVLKILLPLLVIYKWSQKHFDLNTYGELILEPVLCITLVS